MGKYLDKPLMDKYQNKGSNPLILDKSGGAILKISYVKEHILY